jgi:hypothetical protein
MSEGTNVLPIRVSYLGQTAHRDVILVSVLVLVFSLAPVQCGFCDACPQIAQRIAGSGGTPSCGRGDGRLRRDRPTGEPGANNSLRQ